MIKRAVLAEQNLLEEKGTFQNILLLKMPEEREKNRTPLCPGVLKNLLAK